MKIIFSDNDKINIQNMAIQSIVDATLRAAVEAKVAEIQEQIGDADITPGELIKRYVVHTNKAIAVPNKKLLVPAN